MNETVARTPKLRKISDTVKVGYAYVALDETLIPIDRVAAHRPFYTGKSQEARDEPAGHRQP